MQSKVTLEVYLQHETSLAHPELLLQRISALLYGNVIRLPSSTYAYQEIELWAVTLLTGVEDL